MRPLWKTPGRSAIDAVASFVGSYSLALLITNRVYKEGKYTTKEAAIIATGFSTVSATFMIIIAKTLDIMHLWNVYFWTTRCNIHHNCYHCKNHASSRNQIHM